MTKPITVYILQSKSLGKRYIGITNNLKRRLKEHSRKGSTVEKLLGNFFIIHSETFSNYSDARVREVFLKSGKGREWMNQNFKRDQP